MLTQEQEAVVEAACNSNNDRIIAVNATAGSGKTTTANGIIQTYKPKNGFYTAFNKAIVKDSSKKFGNLLDCRTIHSLAYKYIKPKEVADLTYSSITEDISYEEKEDVITTLDNFFRSSSTDLEEYIKEHDKTHLKSIIINYANLMGEGYIPVTFNYMLKELHLRLLEGSLEIENDLLILDEAQDAVAVTLEIFKLIHANRKVLLGDRFQNIYSFMQTVNAFEVLKGLNTFSLTKSFRCHPTIAAIVEDYGKRYLDINFKYTGNEAIKCGDTTAYISRTNAYLIKRMHELLLAGYTFKLTRTVNEIFELPFAMLSASNGMTVYSHKYKFLEKEYKKYASQKSKGKSFFSYIVEVTENDLLESTSRLLYELTNKNINLYDLKSKISSMTPNKKLVLTTAHAFKGLEADNVFIEQDLNNKISRIKSQYQFASNIATIRKNISQEDKEELNTYYVALSRAKCNLENVDFY